MTDRQIITRAHGAAKRGTGGLGSETMISETFQNIILMLFVLAVILVLAMIPFSIGHSIGYKNGQIDALNGKIHYRLEKQENSEFIWVECPDVCEYEKGE